MQAAARHPTFISDTIFSSPANITTIDYVNGSSVLVYSSAPSSELGWRTTQRKPTTDVHEGLHALFTHHWSVPVLLARDVTKLSSALAMQMRRPVHPSRTSRPKPPTQSRRRPGYTSR